MAVRKDVLEPLKQQPAPLPRATNFLHVHCRLQTSVTLLVFTCLPRVLIAYYFQLIASILVAIVRMDGMGWAVPNLRQWGCLVLSKDLSSPVGAKPRVHFSVWAEAEYMETLY